MIDKKSQKSKENASEAENKQNKAKKEAKADPKDAQIEELTDTLKRLQAEFENYKKRCDRDSESYRKFATKDLVQKILPILDSFELALKNKKEDTEFTKGIELVFAQLFSALESEGLKRINTNGTFDPMKHEVLMTAESDKEDGTILEELQKGYTLHDTLLRTAKVRVAKKR